MESPDSPGGFTGVDPGFGQGVELAVEVLLGGRHPCVRVVHRGRVLHLELSGTHIHRVVVVARAALEDRGSRVLEYAIENKVAMSPTRPRIVLHPGP